MNHEAFRREYEADFRVRVQPREGHFVAVWEQTGEPIYARRRNHSDTKNVRVQIQHEDFTMCQKILEAYLSGATHPFSHAIASTLPSELPAKYNLEHCRQCGCAHSLANNPDKSDQ